MFVVVDGNENYTFIGEQSFGNSEPLVHEGEPLGMTVGILSVNIGIVIDEIFVARVVRRIDIDDINLAFVGVAEGCESFKVVALDKDMVGGIRSIGDDAAFLYLGQHGKLLAQAFLHVLLFIFPNKAVFLMLPKQPYQVTLFLVGEAFELLELGDKL